LFAFTTRVGTSELTPPALILREKYLAQAAPDEILPYLLAGWW